MLKKTFIIALAVGFLFVSCNQKAKQNNQEQTATVQEQTDDIVNKTVTNPDGTILELSFNNTKGTATAIFKGETIQMESQRPASGIWFKNEHYELTGKGEDVTLLKNGKEVFSHKGEKTIVKDYKSKDGKEITVNIYNETNTATVVFEGETIDLQGQKPASGIWYKNDHYELRGKGDNIELTKSGETVFKSK